MGFSRKEMSDNLVSSRRRNNEITRPKYRKETTLPQTAKWLVVCLLSLEEKHLLAGLESLLCPNQLQKAPWRRRILFDVNWIEGNLSLSVLVSREDDLVVVDWCDLPDEIVQSASDFCDCRFQEEVLWLVNLICAETPTWTRFREFLSGDIKLRNILLDHRERGLRLTKRSARWPAKAQWFQWPR